MNITFEMQGNWGGKISAALKGIAADIEKFPQRRMVALGAMLKREVMQNFHTLSYGGHVIDSDGFSIRWSRHRAMSTIRIRQAAGKGALFPILSLTGKMERGLTGGSVSASRGHISFRPSNDIFLLLVSHQVTGRPIPGGRNSYRGNMPIRKVIFWSRAMMRQMETLLRADIRRR